MIAGAAAPSRKTITCVKGNKSKKLIFKDVKDIRDVLSKTSNGLFNLKNRTLRKKFRKYFLNRDDDGVEEEDIRVIPK